MSRLAIAAFALAAATASAHYCPYDWNIELTKGLSFKETPLSNAVEQVNAAVRAETRGRIQKAVILDTTPLTITKVTDDPAIAAEMDVLIDRYHREMAPIIAKGAQGYETCPVTDTIAPKFPLACQLSGIAACAEMGYEEKEEGAIFSRRPKLLECRGYKINDAFLKAVVEKQKAGQIHSDFQPIPGIFAQESGMTWTIFVGEGPRSFRGDFILDAVTLYLPDRKVMLVLETPEGHKAVEGNLRKLGYLQE